MTGTLDSYSLVAIYSAMAVYTIAFIMFTLDLSRRSAATPSVAAVAQSASVGGGTAVLEKTDAPAPAKGPRYLRAAMALTVLAWLLQVSGVVLRGIAAERVPWANMFEFSITATSIIVGVFLLVQFWQDLRFLGAFITGFALIALGVATVNFYVDVVPLPPALQSTWLVIHVFVATLGTGFFALGAGLSIVQLLQARREATKSGLKFLSTLPDAVRLETLAYRVNVVGFVFWTFTLIAGAIWAERAWGRYWGWDTKEVWTFIIWVIFAGYIHARATKGWRGSRSAWLAIIGFTAVLFNFTIVNLFFKGLHAYSGL
ncbi:c-type cytochrome biogenesis protein CcsB [Antiquaquibacter soli]|uniref:C-type cytochrome biogenesis protein CcsB n=1 Tax=Antiquaquibacter soli TaxID=3064523 RepID=A0ABT9BJY5_9MICO|nr:c-type cytochrome biogenesis protein CcsB [Protaetiibacter sp. WY-16]MDO7880869.1 c-type cytochrome biogenesis protein CcsB [Protaetiibacter sp. WY-16]